MHPEEEKYGALFYSGFKLLNDSIELHYSISIPLTDVGIGVVIRLDRDGRIVYMRS